MLGITLRFAALWVALAVSGLLLLKLVGLNHATFATTGATWGAFVITAVVFLWRQRRTRRS